MTGVAGLVLAGGEGKRWGGPKAIAGLPDGRTFLEACAATFFEAGVSPVSATLPPEAENLACISHQLPASAVDAPHPAVLSRFAVLDVLSSTTPRPSDRKRRWARHLDALAMEPGEKCRLGIDGLGFLVLPESGMDMFGSLRVGLCSLVKISSWQKVAILPVDHPLVRPETVAELAAVDAPAAIPSFNGKHGHPVCLERSVAESIVTGEATGPTLREVLREVGAVSVPVDDSGVIANCNTPAALAAALAGREELN